MQAKKSSLKPKRSVGLAEKTTGKLTKAVKAISHSARKVVKFSNNLHTLQPVVDGRKEASNVAELQLKRQAKKPKPRGEGGESDTQSKLNLSLSQKRSLGSHKWPRDIHQHGAVIDVEPVGKSATPTKTTTTTKTKTTRTKKGVSQLKKIDSDSVNTANKDSVVTGGKTTTKKVKKLRIKSGTIGRKSVSTGYAQRIQPRLAYSIGPDSLMLSGRQG